MLDFFLSPWWPFLVLAAIGIVLSVLAYRFPQWRERRWKVIQISATLVTAAAAVSIPLVLHRDGRDTRTLEQVNEVSREIGDFVAEKDRLDRLKKQSGHDRFSHEYISNDREIEVLVFKILNEYEFICLGGNQRLFSNAVIQNLRWAALDQTWKDYHGYIAQHRKGGGSRTEAWIQCEIWLKNNPRPDNS
jgi:hypothetical protein